MMPPRKPWFLAKSYCPHACSSSIAPPGFPSMVCLKVRSPGVLKADFSVSISNRRSNSSSLRSEEHTSELQSPCNFVCSLLLEKKKVILLTIYIIQSHH